VKKGKDMVKLDQLRKGSTDVLILSVLENEAKYGYQIMRELEQSSEGFFTMTAALLYPALHQLEQDGMVNSEWLSGQGKRRRKYYQLTPAGHRALADNRSTWKNFVEHISMVLHPSAPAKGGG
jgi:PadR family transcriptional regulator, regulatory protein PadR